MRCRNTHGMKCKSWVEIQLNRRGQLANTRGGWESSKQSCQIESGYLKYRITRAFQSYKSLGVSISVEIWLMWIFCVEHPKLNLVLWWWFKWVSSIVISDLIVFMTRWLLCVSGERCTEGFPEGGEEGETISRTLSRWENVILRIFLPMFPNFFLTWVFWGGHGDPI